jgi:nucleoside-diphosphate-sugar epimerase
VVYASTVAVHGLKGRGPNAPVTESTPYASQPDRFAHYMRSKIEAERLALKRAHEDGLPVTILRLGILYGPGARRSIGRGFLQFGPVRLVVGGGHNRMPYLYVGNAVDALLLAAVRPEAVRQVYMIVDAPQVSVRDVISQAAALSGETARFVPLPAFLMNGVAGLLESRAEGVPPRLTRYVVDSAKRDLWYDTTKAVEHLGWRQEVSLEEGLRRTLQDELG